MTKVDMSAQAVTARLKKTAELRRLGLLLGKAKLKQHPILDTESKSSSPDRKSQKPR